MNSHRKQNTSQANTLSQSSNQKEYVKDPYKFSTLMSNDLCFYSKQDSHSQGSYQNEVEVHGGDDYKPSPLDNYEEDVALPIENSPAHIKKHKSHKRNAAILSFDSQAEKAKEGGEEIKEQEDCDTQVNNYINPINKLKTFAAKIPINTDQFAKKEEQNQKRIICDLEDMNQILDQSSHSVDQDSHFIENQKLGILSGCKGQQQFRSPKVQQKVRQLKIIPPTQIKFKQQNMFQKSIGSKGNKQQQMQYPKQNQAETPSSQQIQNFCFNPETHHQQPNQQNFNYQSEFQKPKHSLPVNSYNSLSVKHQSAKYSNFLEQTERKISSIKQMNQPQQVPQQINEYSNVPLQNIGQSTKNIVLPTDVIFNQPPQERFSLNAINNRSPNNAFTSSILLPSQKESIFQSKVSPLNQKIPQKGGFNNFKEAHNYQKTAFTNFVSTTPVGTSNPQRRLVTQKEKVSPLNFQNTGTNSAQQIHIERPQMANIQRNKLQQLLKNDMIQAVGERNSIPSNSTNFKFTGSFKISRNNNSLLLKHPGGVSQENTERSTKNSKTVLGLHGNEDYHY